MESSRKTIYLILRILWAIAGLVFIYMDIKYLNNSALKPDTYLIMGILFFMGGLTGIAGGVGASLIAFGILRYKANMLFSAGSIAFAESFTTFDKIAGVLFAVSGLYILVLQLQKNFSKLRQAK